MASFFHKTACAYTLEKIACRHFFPLCSSSSFHCDYYGALHHLLQAWFFCSQQHNVTPALGRAATSKSTATLASGTFAALPPNSCLHSTLHPGQSCLLLCLLRLQAIPLTLLDMEPPSPRTRAQIPNPESGSLLIQAILYLALQQHMACCAVTLCAAESKEPVRVCDLHRTKKNDGPWGWWRFPRAAGGRINLLEHQFGRG